MFQSQFINIKKTVFAISNEEILQERMEEPPISLVITDSSSRIGPGFIIYKFQQFIGRISCLWEDLNTGRTVVKFDYWYKNAFTRLLRAELIVAQQLNQYIVGENKMDRFRTHLFEESTDSYFTVEKTDMDPAQCPDMSRERFDADVAYHNAYEKRMGYNDGFLTNRLTYTITA